MSGDDLHVVLFRIGGHEFAFNVFEVERILRFDEPVPLPEAPDFLEGVLPYGGATIPVVDLRKRLSAEADRRDETRVIVLEWAEGRIALVVDVVTEIARVSAEDVAPPKGYVRGLAPRYVTGIISHGPRTIMLLNPTEILTSTERLALESLSTLA
jgi:purine-binding chemotaxis protein CheW